MSRLTHPLRLGRRVVPWRFRGRLVHRLRKARRRWGSPLVTVVVTTQDSVGWVARCLGSVRSQSHRRLQIVVVDAGSTDETLQVVRTLAAKDKRMSVLARPDRGVGAARNAGAATAKGRFLIFVDAEDTLPRHALRTLVGSLAGSGSDIAVGRPRKSAGGRLSDPHWAPEVHLVDRRAITVDDFPAVMHDLLLGDRMFRTSFWTAGLTFPADVPQPSATLASAYVAADRIDVLRAVTLHWTPSEGDGLLGTKVLDIDRAQAFAADVLAATAHVDERGTDPERRAWTTRVIDIDLEPRIRASVDAVPEVRQVLQRLAATFVARADAEALAEVRVVAKALAWLTAEGRWAEVEQAVEHVALYGSSPRTSVVDGEVQAEDGTDVAVFEPMPVQVRRLAAGETRLAAAVQRVAWVDDVLEITGWAFIRGIDLTDVQSETTLRLVDPASGESWPFDVEPVVLPAATRWGNDAFQRYENAGFVARLRPADCALLGTRPATDRVWRLEATVRALDVERTGLVRTLIAAGSASLLRSAFVDDVLLAPVRSVTDGLTLRARRPAVCAQTLAVSGGALIARLRTEDVVIDRLRVWSDRARHRVEVPVTRNADGTYSAEVSLPATDSTRPVRNRIWQVRAVTADGGTRRLAWDTPHDSSRIAGAPGPGAAVWRRTPRGHVEVVEGLAVLEVVDVERTSDVLRLVVEATGAELPVSATLASHRVTLPADTVRTEGDRTVLEFPLRVSRWDRAPRVWPTGTYALAVQTEDGAVRRPWPSWRLLDRLPEEEEHPECVLRFGRQAPGTFTVRARPPLTDAEWGKTAQRRMQLAHPHRSVEPEDAMLFQCYRGEVATDSQLALHEELHRRGAPLELYWGVADHSVDLPAGARPVLIGSARWYELLANARYLSNNVDFPRWWLRRGHQVFIQTFHGYPFKSMGVSFWKEQGRNERDLQRETARLGRAWSVALVPAPFCEELYRREYRFTGEVMVSGYPRDDALVGEGVAERRARARARLGIRADQKAVLYAPTWRESISADTWNAPMFDALDLDRLATELGSDHVLLLRGHNHNLGEATRFSDHAVVLDVTDHPDINELVLASDVAVLDYSSLRFDYALTGKPMLFFVPDLEDYVQGRSFLYDFEPTAPGPWLRTTEEVADALLRLDEVAAEYADARAEFHRRFNQLNDGHAAARVIDAWIPEARLQAKAG
ncbi:CDP-glycerol glycerophosphotransferase family protein [Modestobacter altitudinis]|uniref:CDP-glycerol glycerophosphotransferase family protein n=1 Tax=Modestobacter altitudinis TaxID=2213158 RepID=UPI0014865A92|nr:CDP-glycerol glycerophosphotransferase family protein [Modestobacter altitudinis]